MRLSKQNIQTIRDLVRKNYGTDAAVRLFGSRVDDNARGGDIDLLVELPARATLRQELALSAKLEQHLGRPVDVLTTWPGQRTRPIVQIARLTGVRL